MVDSIRNLAACVAAVALLSAAGCTTRETVRTVEETPSGDQVVVKETTVVEEDLCDGVISCTLDFAGEVIAFPFRLIGGLFQVIF